MSGVQPRYVSRASCQYRSEPQIASLTKQMAELLVATAPPSARWHYEPMPEETYATIYPPAALRAFRTLFKPDSTHR